MSPETGDGGTELWLEPPLPPTGPLRGVLVLTTVMKYIYVGWNPKCRIFFGIKNVFQITAEPFNASFSLFMMVVTYVHAQRRINIS
jgi:hypothetical protein